MRYIYALTLMFGLTFNVFSIDVPKYIESLESKYCINISGEGNDLSVDAGDRFARKTDIIIGDNEINILFPLSQYITYLNLSSSKMTYIGFMELSRFINLKVLSITSGKYNDDCIIALRAMPDLEQLRLINANITNKSLKIIS